MKNLTVAFIGAGNITRALIAGLITNQYPATQIWASNPSRANLDFLHENFSIHTTQDNREAASHADIIIMAVKPTKLPAVCQEIKDIIKQQQPLVISVAVGSTVALMQRWLEGQFAILLAMPNISATVGAAVTGLHASANVNDAQKDIAEAIFRSIGITLWLETEAEIGLVCAISGSGPAYVFYIMEIIQQTALDMGLSSHIAKLLTEQTVLGAAKMALESEQSFETLRHRVTSPKGTTEAAINILEKHHIHEVFAKALAAAASRYTEVTKLLDNLGDQA